jgi:AmmeMemoRadiSam system protein A
MSCTDISLANQAWLLSLARKSIEHACETGQMLTLEQLTFDESLNESLNEEACCFITLHKKGQLRGCIGSLVAYQALVEDVIENACGAALNDFRFPPIQRSEVEQLTIEISVLTPTVLIPCESEQELLTQLVPFEDGLIIEDELHKATFLPSVWQQLGEKKDFLAHLKAKAGMRRDYWSNTMKAYRYSTISFHDDHISS